MASPELGQLRWRKSSRSGSSGNACVEIALIPSGLGAAAIRDSKNPEGDVLVLTAAQWATFRTAIGTGEADQR